MTKEGKEILKWSLLSCGVAGLIALILKGTGMWVPSDETGAVTHADEEDPLGPYGHPLFDGSFWPDNVRK